LRYFLFVLVFFAGCPFIATAEVVSEGYETGIIKTDIDADCVITNGSFALGEQFWRNENNGALDSAIEDVVNIDGRPHVLHLDSRAGANYYLRRTQTFPACDMLNKALRWDWKLAEYEGDYGLAAVWLEFRDSSSEVIARYFVRRHTGRFSPYDCSNTIDEYCLDNPIAAVGCEQTIGVGFSWERKTLVFSQEFFNELSCAPAVFDPTEIDSIKIWLQASNNAGSGVDAFFDEFVYFDYEAPTIAHWKFNEMSGDTAFDVSGGGHHGIISGAIWDNGLVDGALRFDGTDDSVLVSHSADFEVAEGTIEFIFKTASDGSSGGLLQKENEGIHSGDLEVFINGETGLLTIESEGAGHQFVLYSDWTPTRWDTSWHHLAYAFGAVGMRMYVDGVLQERQESFGASLIGNVWDIVMGKKLTLPTASFDGWLDEVRISNRVLAVYEFLPGIGEVFADPVLFSATVEGDTTMSPLIIHNPGLEAVTFTITPQLTAPFFFSEEFQDDLAQGIRIPSGSSLTAAVYFAPNEAAEYNQSVFLEQYDTNDTLAFIIVRGQSRELSFDVLFVDPSNTTPIQQDEKLEITVRMAEAIEADSVLLYYALGGKSTFHGQRMGRSADPGGDYYQGSISAEDIGARGIEAYVEAHNGVVKRTSPDPNTPICFRVWIDGLTFPRPQPTAAYMMISVPLEIPLKNGVLDLFYDNLGKPDVYTWRMFAHIPGTIDYVTPRETIYVELPNDTILSGTGRAYWLKCMDPVTLDTSPIRCLSTSALNDFVLTLRPGWNMIGNPFNFPVSWDDVTVNGHSVVDAVEGPRQWIVEKGQYNDPLDSVRTLLPFEGYWVKNLTGSDVVLQIPPVDVAYGEERSSVAGATDAGEISEGWVVGVDAACGETTDRGNYAGVTLKASQERDRWDHSETPMNPGRALSLYFPHEDWENNPGRYTVDMRGVESARQANPASSDGIENGRGHVWAFDVAKNYVDESGGDKVVLKFSGMEDVPVEWEVLLTDRKLGCVVDLREEDRYSYFERKRAYVDEEEKTRFALLVGDETYINSYEDKMPNLPTATVLHQNYPNPFNPSTVIRYESSEAGHVSVRIYDVTGALVKVLEDRERQPGRYEIGWNGENDRGEHVSSGVYFYRFRTNQYNKTRKMLLLK
jgi:hypothetical protein